MNVIHLILQQIILFTVPLMTVALGDMFSERNGVVSTVLEGVMVMGAFTGILFLDMIRDRMDEQLQLLPAILISTTTGTVFTFFHAYASINMKASQTISRTALNMFAPTFAILVTGVIQGTQQIQSSNTFRIGSVLLLGSIPLFGPLLFRSTYITAYLGTAIPVLSALVLYRIRFGLRLRFCGEHPHAANATSINVYRIQYAGVPISGVLGGLGGLVFAVPTSTNSNADAAGYGFLTLAALIFGQWKPVRIMQASSLFRLMKAVVTAYSDISLLAAIRIPSCVYKMVPYLAAPIVLISTSGNSQASRASGAPYNGGQRQADIYIIIW